MASLEEPGTREPQSTAGLIGKQGALPVAMEPEIRQPALLEIIWHRRWSVLVLYPKKCSDEGAP